MIQRYDTGPRMSEMTVHAGVAYLAGQVAEDASAGIVGQTQQVLAQIDALLAQAGSDKSKILRAQIFLADIADFAGMNEVYAKYFTSDFPARSTVQVAALPKGAKVEIEIVAHF